MQIIKNGKIVSDDCRHLGDDETATAGRFTVSFSRWLRERDSLLATGAVVGVRLRGDDPLADIASDLKRLGLIVLDFPSLADGRAFSQARLLRDRYGYSGEIRACGDFIRDQVYFLARVGVNAFEPAGVADLNTMLSALEDFSVNYQAAADDRRPLYRRRA